MWLNLLTLVGLSLAVQAGDWGPWKPAFGDSEIEFRFKLDDHTTVKDRCVVTFQIRFADAATKDPAKTYKVHYVITFSPVQEQPTAGAWYAKPTDPPEEAVVSLRKPSCPSVQSYHAQVE